MDIVDWEPTVGTGIRNAKLRAGTGACTTYIDEAICRADNSCYWRPNSETCALRPLRQAKSGTKRTANTNKKAAAMLNPWIEHVKEYRRKHPGMTYKEAMQQSKTTYTKMKGGYYW